MDSHDASSHRPTRQLVDRDHEESGTSRPAGAENVLGIQELRLEDDLFSGTRAVEDRHGDIAKSRLAAAVPAVVNEDGRDVDVIEEVDLPSGIVVGRSGCREVSEIPVVALLGAQVGVEVR